MVIENVLRLFHGDLLSGRRGSRESSKGVKASFANRSLQCSLSLSLLFPFSAFPDVWGRSEIAFICTHSKLKRGADEGSLTRIPKTIPRVLTQVPLLYHLLKRTLTVHHLSNGCEGLKLHCLCSAYGRRCLPLNFYLIHGR